jgi:hypothetical protein
MLTRLPFFPSIIEGAALSKPPISINLPRFMEHAIFIGFLLLVAWVFALWEIQIEGKHGWAENLPTWRMDTQWTRALYKRPITGYHLYAQVFVFFIAHSPFGLSLVPWGLRHEMRILAFLVLFWVLEDFLWFLCNPAYGWRNFKPQSIAWHRDCWWWIAPRDYWVGVPLGIFLYLVGCG